MHDPTCHASALFWPLDHPSYYRIYTHFQFSNSGIQGCFICTNIMISYGMVLRIRRTILGLSNTVRFYKIACYVSLHAFCRLWILGKSLIKRGTCIIRGKFGPLWSQKLKVAFHQFHPICLLEEWLKCKILAFI